MYGVQSIEAVGARLQTYQDQLTALSNALSALRDLSDELAASLQSDQAAMAEATRGMTSALAIAQSLATPEPTDSITDRGDVTAADAMSPLALDEDRTAIASQDDDLTVLTDLDIAISEHLTAASPADVPNECETTELAAPSMEEPVAALPAEVEPTAAVETEAQAETQAEAAADTTSEIKPELSPEAASAAALAAIAATASAAAPAATAEVAPADTAAKSTVVDLASRLKKAKQHAPLRQRVTRALAALVLTAGIATAGYEILQSSLGQRLMELGACDADLVSSNPDCAMLAWLLL